MKTSPRMSAGRASILHAALWAPLGVRWSGRFGLRPRLGDVRRRPIRGVVGARGRSRRLSRRRSRWPGGKGARKEALVVPRGLGFVSWVLEGEVVWALELLLMGRNRRQNSLRHLAHRGSLGVGETAQQFGEEGKVWALASWTVRTDHSRRLSLSRYLVRLYLWMEHLRRGLCVEVRLEGPLHRLSVSFSIGEVGVAAPRKS